MKQQQQQQQQAPIESKMINLANQRNLPFLTRLVLWNIWHKLSIYVSMYVAIYLSIYLSIYLFTYLSIYLFIGEHFFQQNWPERSSTHFSVFRSTIRKSLVDRFRFYNVQNHGIFKKNEIIGKLEIFRFTRHRKVIVIFLKNYYPNLVNEELIWSVFWILLFI